MEADEKIDIQNDGGGDIDLTAEDGKLECIVKLQLSQR